MPRCRGGRGCRAAPIWWHWLPDCSWRICSCPSNTQGRAERGWHSCSCHVNTQGRAERSWHGCSCQIHTQGGAERGWHSCSCHIGTEGGAERAQGSQDHRRYQALGGQGLGVRTVAWGLQGAPGGRRRCWPPRWGSCPARPTAEGTRTCPALRAARSHHHRDSAQAPQQSHELLTERLPDHLGSKAAATCLQAGEPGAQRSQAWLESKVSRLTLDPKTQERAVMCSAWVSSPGSSSAERLSAGCARGPCRP